MAQEKAHSAHNDGMSTFNLSRSLPWNTIAIMVTPIADTIERTVNTDDNAAERLSGPGMNTSVTPAETLIPWEQVTAKNLCVPFALVIVVVDTVHSD
jgi:hypothetical protein